MAPRLTEIIGKANLNIPRELFQNDTFDTFPQALSQNDTNNSVTDTDNTFPLELFQNNTIKYYLREVIMLSCSANQCERRKGGKGRRARQEIKGEAREGQASIVDEND